MMSCDRSGCDNIMCDRYSREYGYICYECFEELVESGPETNVKEFMESYKQKVSKEFARARFEVEFPMQN